MKSRQQRWAGAPQIFDPREHAEQWLWVGRVPKLSGHAESVAPTGVIALPENLRLTQPPLQFFGQSSALRAATARQADSR